MLIVKVSAQQRLIQKLKLMDDVPIGSCDIFAIIQMGVTVSKEHCSEHERASRTLLVKFVFRNCKMRQETDFFERNWFDFHECARGVEAV